MNSPSVSEKETSASHPLKALDLLEGLAQRPNGAGISELAELTSLSKSSVHRILTALVERQYVVKDENTKIYRLGFRLLSLSGAILESLELKQVARSGMRQVAEACGETVHLLCLDGLDAVYIDKVDTPNAIGLKSQIGKRIPLYCTGGGKAILAYKSPAFVQSYIDKTPLLACTQHTLTTPQALLDELAQVRQQGYALDREEHHSNITCIAAPLFSRSGEVAASISISAPSYRFPLERALSYRELLLSCAQSISQQLP